MKLVIVESYAKSQVIQEYLGSKYIVFATYGHLRDLPSKSGSVDTSDFSFKWNIIEKSRPHITKIAKAAKQADEIIMATDLDREGEAIAWHIDQILKQKSIDMPTKRIVFSAVTKRDIHEAMSNPRQIDIDLVHAYFARLALDYIVGFSLSPILWRRLPIGKSAGRVQSVALRLIVEREKEIKSFISQEYFNVTGNFHIHEKEAKGNLISVDGVKLEKFDLKGDAAKDIADRSPSIGYAVNDIDIKTVKRNPNPPFTTATLQQEAFQRLNMRGSQTMSIAQKLYEGVDIDDEKKGLITYMRTDSVQLSEEAQAACIAQIKKQFGDRYVSPRKYKNRSKHSQEAHEAIRPTDLSLTPQKLPSFLDDGARKLYALIWVRAIASQMASAEFFQQTMKLSGDDLTFQINGRRCKFDGFLSADPDMIPKEQFLPVAEIGDSVICSEAVAEQHFTKPVARYNDASLIKQLESLGIGRPSTYTRIIQVLCDRDYIARVSKALVPSDRSFVIIAFLTHFFKKYLEYDFTADLEDQLDMVMSGERDWKELLGDFWHPFSEKIGGVEGISMSEVIGIVGERMHDLIFPDGNKCSSCGEGVLSLRIGRMSPFIACSNYPECRATRSLFEDGAKEYPRVLGIDPSSNAEIRICKGPYGFYLDFGDERCAIPDTCSDIGLEEAIEWKPKVLGIGKKMQATVKFIRGKKRNYVTDGVTKAIHKEDSIPTLEEAEIAIELAMEKKSASKITTKVIKTKKPSSRRAKTTTKIAR